MLKNISYYKNQLEQINWDFTDNKAEPIHSIHPYPAKFIPQIPQKIIETLPVMNNGLIVDPFCGSGVTLVEAENAGYDTLGVDLNPIACLISRVKTQILNENFMSRATSIIDYCRNYNGDIEIPLIPNLDHWFKKDVQEGLSILIEEIDKENNKSLNDALRFCFSSIIVKVSNQDSDTRYAAKEKKWKKDDVFNFFLQAALKLEKHKSDFSQKVSVDILNKNSLNLIQTDFKKKIGLVITSPPYPNAYEYWLYHKYRMWWLKFDPISVKNEEIGARAHYFSKKEYLTYDFEEQMNKLLNILYSNSEDNCFVCFVVGNSKVHGKILKNDDVIVNQGLKVGFEHITTITRNIKSSRKSFNLSHARIKQEYIVILKK